LIVNAGLSESTMTSLLNLPARVIGRLARELKKRPAPDKAKIALLSKLMDSPPNTRPAVDEWASETTSLIDSLVLSGMPKEDIAATLVGLISYRKTGITPAASHGALIRSYENTAGLFQEMLHRALFDASSASRGAVQSKLFGTVGENVVNAMVGDLRNDGYCVLPFKVSPVLVDTLKKESLGYSYKLKGGSESKTISGIDPNNPPDCVSASAVPDSVTSSSALQEINEDHLFVEIASQYLGTPVSAIDSSFWYTFANGVPSSDSAQLFHYDLDTIRWIKVFIYLSDVDRNRGPHEYVVASHLATNKPPKIMVRNYARVSDEEIDTFFPGRRRSLLGEAGTVIIGDTRCFHKGNAVDEKYRLIYSPIYAPSRLGYFHG
jgi:hypothetical protein